MNQRLFSAFALQSPDHGRSFHEVRARTDYVENMHTLGGTILREN